MTFKSGGKHGVSQLAWSTSRPWGQWSPEPTQTSDTTTASSRTDAGCSNEGLRLLIIFPISPHLFVYIPHFYSLLAR